MLKKYFGHKFRLALGLAWITALTSFFVMNWRSIQMLPDQLEALIQIVPTPITDTPMSGMEAALFVIFAGIVFALLANILIPLFWRSPKSPDNNVG